jgi:glycerol uptake facilitator-like aquaporin
MSSSTAAVRWYHPKASINDLRSVLFWKDVAAELLTVTVLMTTIVLVLITTNEEHYKINTTHLGLYATVVVYLLLEGYGPINGGVHLNPAASFSLFLAGKISLAKALAYILVQTAGSAAGAGLGYLMTPENLRDSFHAFDPVKHGMTLPQSVLMEAFFTFNLVFVALSCHDVVNRVPATLPCLPIACCIGLGILAAGTHTGGLMNPIIPFAPAILAQNFTNHWIYWVGPFLGGPTAVPVYKLFIFIKVKFSPKAAALPAVVTKESALTRDELIGLLNKLTKSQEADNAV